MKDQLTIGWDEFVAMDPCWFWREISPKHTALLERCKAKKPCWSALDILAIPNVEKADIFWVVFHPELMTEMQMHEAACRFAEYALSKVANPDPRSVEGIKKKRAWMRGEITDEELDDAEYATYKAAWEPTRHPKLDAAWEATWEIASGAAWNSARDAARATSWKEILGILRDYLMEEYKE